MSARPRGHAAWRPRASSLALVDLALELVAAEAQVLVRRVLYVASERGLTNSRGVPLDKRNPNHYETVSTALSRARRAGLLPWEAVADTTERLDADGFAGADDFRAEVIRAAQRYRVDRQAGQPVYLVAWSEHRGLRQALAPVCAEYGVPLVLSGGFDSTSGRHTEAEQAQCRDVPTVVLHLGDRDKAGDDIFEVVTDDLRQLSHGAVEEVVRVALTPEQMREQDPQATSMQVDAVPLPLLRGLLTEAINERQDPDARQAGLDREAGERAEVVAWASGWAA